MHISVNQHGVVAVHEEALVLGYLARMQPATLRRHEHLAGLLVRRAVVRGVEAAVLAQAAVAAQASTPGQWLRVIVQTVRGEAVEPVVEASTWAPSTWVEDETEAVATATVWRV